MKNYYVKFGRKFAIPSTVQVKHEIMRMVLADKNQPALTVAAPQAQGAKL